MYLHIGENILVKTDDVIAILDKESCFRPLQYMSEFLEKKSNVKSHLDKKLG